MAFEKKEDITVVGAK